MTSLRRLLMAGGGGGSFRSRLQFGGADASTTFTDDTGKTWTAFGNAQIDTSMGDQRGLFDGSGDYITTPSQSDLNLAGSESFKLQFTMRFNSKAGFQTIMSKGYSPASTPAWLLQTDNGNGRLIFYFITVGSGTAAIATESTGTINVGQDYAIEVERSGGNLITIKRDGVLVASGTHSSSGTLINNTSVLAIGGGTSTGFNGAWFNGWIKDFRFTF